VRSRTNVKMCWVEHIVPSTCGNGGVGWRLAASFRCTLPGVTMLNGRGGGGGGGPFPVSNGVDLDWRGCGCAQQTAGPRRGCAGLPGWHLQLVPGCSRPRGVAGREGFQAIQKFVVVGSLDLRAKPNRVNPMARERRIHDLVPWFGGPIRVLAPRSAAGAVAG